MTEISVTVVDIAVAFVILVSAAYAAWRGLLRETLSIFSWAVAAYVTLRFFPSFRPVLREFISPIWLSDLIAFVGLFVFVLVPLSFMAFQVSDTMRRTEIGPVDRALGFVFGLGRGLVIVGLTYIVFASLVDFEDQPAALRDARLFPLILNTSDVLLSLVPGDIELAGAIDAIVAPEPAQAAPESPAPEPQTYGADERAALDRLIEATGEQ